jgi:hypothetical protein
VPQQQVRRARRSRVPGAEQTWRVGMEQVERREQAWDWRDVAAADARLQARFGHCTAHVMQL